MSKKIFIQGTLILTLTGLVCRVIGFFYRIFLSHTIGAQGLGLFQLILPVQSIVLAMTVSGIQAVISRLCASFLALKKPRTAAKYFFSGLLLSALSTSVLAILIFENSGFISRELLKEPRTENLIRILAFCLVPAAIHACVTSYYYAKKAAVLPSVIQFLEQLARVGSTCILYEITLSEGRAVTAVIAAGGALFSEIVACLASLLAISAEFQSIPLFSVSMRSFLHAEKTLLRFSVPHSMNRLLLTLLGGMEMILIPQRLRLAGFTSSTALAAYGVFSGMTLPLLLFPSALTNSASLMLLPSVAELQALGYHRRIRFVIQRTCRYCLLLGTFCTLFFFIFGEPIGMLLFHNQTAGIYIRNLSFLCPFLYLNSVLASILNGLGKPERCLLHNVITGTLRIGFVLFSIPTAGMNGYFRGMLLCEALLSLLHFASFFSIERVKV